MVSSVYFCALVGVGFCSGGDVLYVVRSVGKITGCLKTRADNRKRVEQGRKIRRNGVRTTQRGMR